MLSTSSPLARLFELFVLPPRHRDQGSSLWSPNRPYVPTQTEGGKLFHRRIDKGSYLSVSWMLFDTPTKLRLISLTNLCLSSLWFCWGCFLIAYSMFPLVCWFVDDRPWRPYVQFPTWTSTFWNSSQWSELLHR
jgi:hypothetical protein